MEILFTEKVSILNVNTRDRWLARKLKGSEMYVDLLLSEDLFQIDDLEEKIDSGELKLTLEHKEALAQIKNLCIENDCSYFRIVYP